MFFFALKMGVFELLNTPATVTMRGNRFQTARNPRDAR